MQNNVERLLFQPYHGLVVQFVIFVSCVSSVCLQQPSANSTAQVLLYNVHNTKLNGCSL